MRILIVDDEPNLVLGITRGLEAEGFVIATSHDGRDALWKAMVTDYDAIVLDHMLPGLTGAEVVERLRRQGISTPVLMLTAIAQDDAEARALDLGADDYLTKPFSFVVLVARLRALLRRTAAEQRSHISCGSLTLDPVSRRVQRRGQHIELTPREFQFLEYLMRNGEVALTKREILDEVWDGRSEGQANVVEVYAGYLRRKIDAPFGTTSLKTVRGFGYRLDAED
ncbi:MAG: response regulator transcription factor [Actinomycetales bacterium]|nr:response regulator transcription factor [Actinomycetales bacterium]